MKQESQADIMPTREGKEKMFDRFRRPADRPEDIIPIEPYVMVQDQIGLLAPRVGRKLEELGIEVIPDPQNPKIVTVHGIDEGFFISLNPSLIRLGFSVTDKREIFTRVEYYDEFTGQNVAGTRKRLAITLIKQR